MVMGFDISWTPFLRGLGSDMSCTQKSGGLNLMNFLDEIKKSSRKEPNNG